MFPNLWVLCPNGALEYGLTGDDIGFSARFELAICFRDLGQLQAENFIYTTRMNRLMRIILPQQ
jgi:hypothetical protein